MQDTISAKSFAITVLRNTQFPPEEIKLRIDKIAKLFPETRVDFQVFFDFNRFMLSLDDFAKGLQFLEQSEGGVGPVELGQAIKVTTGADLPMYVINIIFKIFDYNDDGELSYNEVMAVMKSRLDRGSRSHLDQASMQFGECVRAQI